MGDNLAFSGFGVDPTAQLPNADIGTSVLDGGAATSTATAPNSDIWGAVSKGLDFFMLVEKNNARNTTSSPVGGWTVDPATGRYYAASNPAASAPKQTGLNISPMMLIAGAVVLFLLLKKA